MIDWMCAYAWSHQANAAVVDAVSWLSSQQLLGRARRPVLLQLQLSSSAL